MKRIIAFLQLGFAYLLLWPHALIYILSSSKTKALIMSDARVINDRMSIKFYGINVILYVIYRDQYYRKMFYHRIGKRALCISWYLPGCSTFEPICKSIGEGIYLAHPSSTYLNAKSIGKNFICRQNTTIGNKCEGDNNSRPIIGDNVSIGANVCVIGDIRVGNNVIIGAGSVVVKDVPDNSVVVGNPARILMKQEHE